MCVSTCCGCFDARVERDYVQSLEQQMTEVKAREAEVMWWCTYICTYVGEDASV